MIQAKSTGLSPFNPKKACRTTETTSAAIIADTSLQALMRHQYQRSSSTAPVPAPIESIHFQASPMDVI